LVDSFGFYHGGPEEEDYVDDEADPGGAEAGRLQPFVVEFYEVAFDGHEKVAPAIPAEKFQGEAGRRVFH